MKTTKKPKAGRKLFDGKNYDIVIQKLEDMWIIGGTDEEAAFNANISKAALSDFLAKNRPISERKEQLLLNPIVHARRVLHNEISKKKNATLALKYLERKRPSEFGPKTTERNEMEMYDDLYQHYLEVEGEKEKDPIGDIINRGLGNH